MSREVGGTEIHVGDVKPGAFAYAPASAYPLFW